MDGVSVLGEEGFFACENGEAFHADKKCSGTLSLSCIYVAKQTLMDAQNYIFENTGDGAT